MNKKLLATLLCGLLFAQLTQAKVVDTTTWEAKDIKENYKNKYFCNLSVADSTCKQNVKNMEQLSGINIDDFGDKSIKNVTLDKVSYQTTNSFPAIDKVTSNVSGLLMLPNTDKPKGVILYYHPTAFNNAGGPSNFKDDNITSQMFDTIYARIYALNGYIVVAADYIGQGDDYANTHPYIFYPKQTVNTAVDLLNSSANIIKNKYSLDANNKLNVYSAGYSEGGAYSIWTAKCLEDKSSCPIVGKLDNLYNYKAAAGLAGAYDLSKTTMGFIKDNNDAKEYKLHSKLVTSMLKPALLANAFMSYLHFNNKDKSISIKDVDEKFFNMDCPFGTQFMCNTNDKQYSFSELFNQKEVSDLKLVSAVYYSALYRKYPNQKSASHYGLPTGNNSMYDLFNEKVFSDSAFMQTMKDADVVDFGKDTKTPLFLFSLKEDSVVTTLNFDKFMSQANKNVSSYQLENSHITTSSINWIPFVKFDISDVDHITGEIYANIFAYKFIDNLNKGSVQ
ncbi:MAG: hypothetical protein ACI8TE_000301 [Francisella sp.]|jgi:hypothetical protein